MLSVRTAVLLQAVAGAAQADAQVGAQVRVSDLRGVLQVPGGSEGAQEHPHGERRVPVFGVRPGVCLEVGASEAPEDPQRGRRQGGTFLQMPSL